jgi:mutator protein MutT
MPAVVFVLLNEREEVLMERRPLDASFFPGHLVYPGGKFEPGESNPLEVLQREAQEELGIYALWAFPLEGAPVSWPLDGGDERRVHLYLVTTWQPRELPIAILDTGHTLFWVDPYEFAHREAVGLRRETSQRVAKWLDWRRDEVARSGEVD